MADICIDTQQNQAWFIVRAGKSSDQAFILEHWYGSYGRERDHGPYYASEQKTLIRSILDRASTSVYVACDLESPDAIHGFLVMGDGLIPRIYYVFVRPEARRLGVARTLLAHWLPRHCVYTHRPAPSLVRVGFRIPKTWSYNYFANFREIA